MIGVQGCGCGLVTLLFADMLTSMWVKGCLHFYDCVLGRCLALVVSGLLDWVVSMV